MYNDNGEEDALPILKEVLKNIGITGKAATIYIFLLKKAVPQYAKDITKLMRSNKALVYRSLKQLQANGFITATMTFPASFAAIPLGVILDNAAKTKKREAQLLEKDKKLLNSVIKSLKIEDTPMVDDEYAILRNQHVAHLKGLELVKQTSNECLIISDRLTRREYDIPEGMRTAVAAAVKKNKARFRLIANIDYSTLNLAKDMVAKLDLLGVGDYIKMRHLELAPASFPGFTLSDESKIILQFDTWKGMDSKSALGMDRLLWTNNKAIIRLAKLLFNKLWDESIDIRERIAELEGVKKIEKESIGNPSPKCL